jgi:hypothetical protein
MTLKLQHHGQLEVMNGCLQGHEPTIHHGFVFRTDPSGNADTFKIIQVRSENKLQKQ